jgi:hypothetical protein
MAWPLCPCVSDRELSIPKRCGAEQAEWTRRQEARLLPVYYLLTPTVQLKDVMKRMGKAVEL